MNDYYALWQESAQKYDTYTKQFPQYKETNKQLVHLANIKENAVIIDLACGTGMTTKALLAHTPPPKKIYAIDFSENMLAQAKKNILAKQVHFIKSAAEDFSQYIKEPIDCVLCNSSFWQFSDYTAVFKEVQLSLKKEGLFIFSLPQMFYEGAPSSGHRAPVISEIFKELAKQGKPISLHRKKTTKQQITHLAISHNLTLVDIIPYSFTGASISDSLSFFKIPAVTPFFANISQGKKDDLMQAVEKKVAQKAASKEKNNWVYIILKKN